MKLKNFNIIILIIVLAFISCEKDEHKIKNVTNDIQLLNDEIIIDEGLNISYQIPINWNEMPASLSEKFVARLGGKDKNNLIVYSPKSFYYDENSSSLLRVGRVGLKDKLTSGVLTLEKYIELFKKYNSDLIIERNEIHLNPDLTIFVIQLSHSSLICLIVGRSKCFPYQRNDALCASGSLDATPSLTTTI